MAHRQHAEYVLHHRHRDADGLVGEEWHFVGRFHQPRATECGHGQIEAIIEAGKVRLRPIVMTSLAMIFGMLPLALGNGEGSETRQAMAYAIIGGLITSTMLTLIVVPIVYVYLDNVRGWIHKTLKRINHLDGGENPSAS